MKNIAVIIPTFAIEYSFDFLNGVSAFAQGKNVRYVVAQTKLPHSTICIFDYQYWTSMEFLRSDEIDAIIVATGVYCATPLIDLDAFISSLKKFANKPVISIAIPLQSQNSYSLLINSNKSFEKIVRHLKEVHNCGKIGFLSALSTKSKEAIERFEAFKEALKVNNLEFYPDMVWDGSFTENESYESLAQNLKSKKDVKFDAIVSSNDNMAIGCIKFLNELGIRVPEDVKVTGFDDSLLAILSEPKLSTINQQVTQQGYDSAKLAWDIVNGKNVSKTRYTELFPKYRQSCGCIDKDNQYDIYMTENGDVVRETQRTLNSIIKSANHMNEQNNIVTLMDMLKGSNTLRQFYFNLQFIVGQINMNSISINLYKEPVYLNPNDNFELPNEMEMYMYSDRISETKDFRPEIHFDPHKQLFASDAFYAYPGIYILQPIYSGESNYGYMLCHLKGNEFAEYNVYLKIIITSLAQAFVYTQKIAETERLEVENTKLQQNNSSLTIESTTDELTGILNRRGFFEVGQRNLNIMQEVSSAGVVFFFDLDGLKKINDTFGHSMGDFAIQLEAKAIKSVFRSSDIIGRLSGDEFGAIALGMNKDQIPKIRRKIESMNRKITKEQKLPFKLSVSLGAVGLESSSVLTQLLSLADVELYKEKKIKHGKQ